MVKRVLTVNQIKSAVLEKTGQVFRESGLRTYRDFKAVFPCQLGVYVAQGVARDQIDLSSIDAISQDRDRTSAYIKHGHRFGIRNAGSQSIDRKLAAKLKALLKFSLPL